MSALYADLSWLPRPPEDFRKRARALDESGNAGAEAMALASTALDVNKLTSLANAIGKVRAKGGSLAPLAPFKLGILGNGTLDFVTPALIGTAARYGFALECVSGAFDQVIQEAMAPESAVNAAKPDAVLIALDYRGLPLSFKAGDAQGATAEAERAVQYINAVRAAIRNNSGAVCIVQTLAVPVEGVFGSFDAIVPGTAAHVIRLINQRLAEEIGGSQDILFDVARLAETVGGAAWFDPGLYNLAKAPFSSTYVPLYADHVGRLIGALRGKSRKCLVLDLDNTLWGGIIGDDGLEGIKLAQGDSVGEAFLTVQRYALALRARGIVLAVSSKNNDDVARQVFREHPEMLLREDHIAVFQANWNDKATNIKSIASELSLGLDSFVFLDDNPVERGLVRQMLPQVAVPELPEDAALYARTLAAAGYFDTIAFSDEDKKRADFYQDNAKRVALQAKAGDVDAYLASLNMTIMFQPFDATGRARISQLINKSNQFNLTTKRYTEADVATAERDPRAFTLQVRLTDDFGDNGMISVVICREDAPKTWTIDTWLMSCRVLGRGVERMVLREILEQARARGITKIVGVFIPTAKNAMVKEHYKGLGFTLVETRDGQETVWELPAEAEIAPAPMRIVRPGEPVAA